MRGELERDFERFRGRGDASALARVFDAAAPELMRVAFHLVRDAGEAEDLVQGVFVAAIEGARDWDRRRRLMPWLLGILARQAARARRDSARRPEPGRLAERGVEDPARASERAEIRGRLAAAITGLPSPYREVLEPHLLDDARAVDIARRLERAPGTVRMQILRGLELLRKSLPPSLATGALLVTGTRGHAAVRAAVMEKAAAATAGLAVASAVAPATLAPLSIGGIAMSLKLVLGVAVAAGLLAGAYLLGGTRGEPTTAPSALAREPDDAAGLAAPDAEPAVAPAAEIAAGPDAERAVVDAPAEADTPAPGVFLVGTLRGMVGGPDSRPWLNAYVEGLQGDIPACIARMDGSFELDVSSLFVTGRGREFLLSINHPAYLVVNDTVRVDDADAERSRTERVEIRRDYELEPASGVRGRVVLPDGWSASDARVALFALGDDGAPAGEAVREIEPDADGAYGIHKREPGRYVVAAWSEGLMPAFERVSVVAGEMYDVPDLVLAPGSTTIRGKLVLLPGMELAGARVAARRADVDPDSDAWSSFTLQWSGGRFHSPFQAARVSGDGTFEIGGLAPGRHVLSIEGVPGIDRVIDLPTVEVAAPSAGAVLGSDLCRITVDVTSAGAPIAHSKLQLVDGSTWYDAYTREEGRCRLLARASRDFVLTVNKEGFVSRELELPAVGRAIDSELGVELVPDSGGGARLVVQARAAAEDLPAKLRFQLTALEDTPYDQVEETVAGSAGRYELADLHHGRYRVELEPDEDTFGPLYDSWYRIAPFEVELRAGETSTRTIEFERGGRLQVEVQGFEGEDADSSCGIVDATGAEVPVRFVTRSYEDNIISIGSYVGTTSLHGSSVAYPNLSPGTYTIRLEVAGYQPVERTFSIRPGETTSVVLQLSR